MKGFHFAQPVWLWMLAVLPFLVALFFAAERRRRAALDRLLAARLQPRLAGCVSIPKRRLGFALCALGVALAFLAAARPQWGFAWEERKERGRDVLVALDTSRSMLATDLLPNRLTRAKLAVQDLLGAIEGDRVGLLAFAGTSFLQAPLTADFNAVRDALQEIDTDIIPRGGTNLAEAITAAADALGKGEGDTRALVIFTDGEELEEDAVAVARANKDKFRIFTVGLGSAEGSLIPVTDKQGGTDFVRDEKGQYVKTRLDERRLREIAEASGGFYLLLQNGPADMNRIVREGLTKMKEHKDDVHFSKQPIERYQWPLAASMACIIASLLLGERRRTIARTIARATAALLLVCGLPAHALHPGIEKFERKDYKGSLGEFERELVRRDVPELQFDAGAAAFELGNYERAADAFSRALGTANPALKNRAAYNLANTLARRGVAQEKKEDKLSDLRDAVRQYDEVLNSDAQHADAKHNRDIVAKLVQQLEQEEKQKQEQDKKDEKKDEKKDDKQDKKDQEKKDQDKKDSSKDGGGEQKKPDPGKDDKQEDKKDPQSSKGQQDDKDKQDGKKDKGDAQKPDESGKTDPKEDKGGKPDSEKQKNPDKPDDRKDGQPEPKPSEPEKQKSGEVKAANPSQEEQEMKEQEAEAAEAAAAAREGRMTEKNARQIFEALKQVDRRVRVLNPGDVKPANPDAPFKNW